MLVVYGSKAKEKEQESSETNSEEENEVEIGGYTNDDDNVAANDDVDTDINLRLKERGMQRRQTNFERKYTFQDENNILRSLKSSRYRSGCKQFF